MSSTNPEEKSTPKADDAGSEVHSANSWETADLGDQSRNQKFLRLMGASKKEHHGRFVIGDQDPKHVRPKPDKKHMEEDLEDQYNQGMEHRLAGGRKGHIGLGFHQEAEEPKKEEEGEDKSQGTDEKGNEDKVDKDGDSCRSNEEKDGGSASNDDNDDESQSKEEDETPDVKEKDERKRESLDQSGPEHDVKKMKFVKSSS